MPRFQVLSDLHLEFHTKPRVRARLAAACPGVTALILAGDISTGPNAEGFIRMCLRNQPERKVLYVLGNHEFYNHEYHAIRSFWRNIDIPGLVVLDNTSVVIDGVHVLGTTLWSSIPEPQQHHVKSTVADYKNIDFGPFPITPADTSLMHLHAQEWLESTVASHWESHGSSVPVVVVTHHLPSYACIAPKYKNSHVKCAFASNLDAFILSTSLIHTWVHGHSHTAVDMYIGTTHVVSNPLGYPGENPGYNTHCAIHVETDTDKQTLQGNNVFIGRSTGDNNSTIASDALHTAASAAPSNASSGNL
jgi:hypothetical protein